MILPRSIEDAETDGIGMRGAFCIKYCADGRHDEVDVAVLHLQLLICGRGCCSRGESAPPTTVLAPAELLLKVSRSRLSPQSSVVGRFSESTSHFEPPLLTPRMPPDGAECVRCSPRAIPVWRSPEYVWRIEPFCIKGGAAATAMVAATVAANGSC